jgi:hypothetical protein
LLPVCFHRRSAGFLPDPRCCLIGFLWAAISGLIYNLLL